MSLLLFTLLFTAPAPEMRDPKAVCEAASTVLRDMRYVGADQPHRRGVRGDNRLLRALTAYNGRRGYAIKGAAFVATIERAYDRRASQVGRL